MFGALSSVIIYIAAITSRKICHFFVSCRSTGQVFVYEFATISIGEMSASATSRKQCVTCNKSGGIFTCDGCQQTFCGIHAIEHRQALGQQLDHLMQEYDGFQQELQQPSTSSKCPLFEKIDQWEAESIARIRKAAEAARTNLRLMIEEPAETVKKTNADMAEKFRSSREADDFSEVDLRQWSDQLKQLQTQLSTPSAVQLIDDKRSIIYLKTVVRKDTNTSASATTTNKEPPPFQNAVEKLYQERFLQTLGTFELSDNDYVIRHTGGILTDAYARGRFLYSAGIHTIRFRIERSRSPYEIFFGCMSSSAGLKDRAVHCLQSVGWFGFNQVYEHGRCCTNCKKYKYKAMI